MATATTTFVHQVTVIEAVWCNDVDSLTYEVFPGDLTLPFFKVDSNGNKVLNNSGSAIATNATNGFVYLPVAAGVPTGTPATSYTGAMPIQFDSTNENFYYYLSSWKKLNKKIQWLCFAAADQVSVFTTGTAKATIGAMPAATIRSIRGFLSTAGSTSSTLDVNLNGTTIMSSDKLLFDANETSTLTASTAPALTTTAIASGDIITIDVDTAGTGAKGWGVLIEVEWT
jgi:hypothetical protein